MRKVFLILFPLLASPSLAYVNLGGAFFGNGGEKIPLENLWPQGNCSTCAITTNWDGTTAKLYGFKNEMVGGMLWIQGGASADATDVTVQLSPLINGSSVLSSTPVLCHNATNYITRDFEIFVATYVQIIGMTELSWPTAPYEERDVPPRFRNPYTVNGNNQGVPNTPSVWSARPDADKHFPDALIPHECKTSFSVFQNSSQGVWLDFHLSTSTIVGDYDGIITVKEGVIVSTTIPIRVHVYNGTMPHQPSFNYAAFVSDDDTNFRLNGIAHGNGCNTAACVNTDRAMYNMIHRHRLIPIGDVQDATLNMFPSQRYQDQLSGNSFTSQYGYRGPGYGTGSPIYSIGTYQHWEDQQSYVMTVSSSFCVMVSSWNSFFSNNYPTVRSFLYLEDEPATLTNVNKWSTWMSTITNCQISTYTVHSFVTNSWVKTFVNAPYLDNPSSTNWIEKTYIQSEWDTAADHYRTSGSTQAWGYNGHPPWSGSCNATEDDGISCWISPWSAYKNDLNGWFQWHSNSWNQQGFASPAENLLWDGLGGATGNPAKTFGFDQYPSTHTAMGRNGFNYANGDGVLMYPGNDLTFPSAAQGLIGPIASYRLKLLRRGQNDYDYLTQANAIDPIATGIIVNALVGITLWDINCFEDADCSYSYGGRLWEEDPDVWEQARADLAAIIESAAPPEPTADKVQIRGRATFRGRVTIR